MTHVGQADQGRHEEDLHRLGAQVIAGSVVFIASALFCLLGGVEWILNDGPVATASSPIFLTWPYSLAYFWPLIIPLGLYLVIARWTGYKLFRHA